MAILVALGAAGPAAAGKIVVPDGCRAFLSVQMKACGVSHYWRCDTGPEGTVWEAHYDAEGAFSLSVYSDEFQWLDSRFFTDGTREHLVERGPDPASLSQLLETGRDTYAFVIRESGPTGSRDVVHQGYDALTGNTVTIDGEDLLETEFSSTALDALSGETIYEVFGNQYVMPEERLFFLGPDTFRQDGEDSQNDSSPLRFIRPGEPGFEETAPQFGCSGGAEIRFLPVAPVAPTGEEQAG